MPNHFHFLLKQKTASSISKFMKQIANAYTRYFNSKYNRTGSLFSGRFKAVLVDKNEVLLHLSRYIHLNPLVAGLVKELKDYPWSSYHSYLSSKEIDICKKEIILDQFKSPQEYQAFVKNHIDYAKELEKIKHFTLDEPF